MLLAIDVGNTDTVIGLFRGRFLVYEARCETSQLFPFIQKKKKAFKGIVSAIVSSVVPSIDPKLRKCLSKQLNIKRLLFVSHKIKLPIHFKIKRPSEVGADRIVNNSAAYLKYKRSLLIVDFGTATTIDYIDKKGAYCGGVIIPGFHTAAGALYDRAAKLKRRAYKIPKRILGTDTDEQLESGILWSHAAMIDRMIELIYKEVKHKPKVVVTGGLSSFIIPLSKYLQKEDAHLTLRGLQSIFNMNI